MKFSIYLSALLIIFLFTFSVSANSALDEAVLDGLDDVYNLRFETAESKFKQLQKSNPNDLKGFFYESLLYFYKALPSRDEKLFNKYIELSDNVIEKAEDKLDKNENDYDALYYKGLSHSYRSLLMLSLNKSLLKAASNGNDGYRILSTLIEKKPDYYDAYMGLGLYKIAIGFVPEKYQWLLSLIGFEGNIKEGRKLLNTSLQNGNYTKVDSKVFLSIFSLKEKEDGDNQALSYSRDLTEQYPGSAVFKVFYSSILLQYGYPVEAEIAANEALILNKNSFQEEIKKSANAVIGTSYFRMNEYQKSIPFLEEYMKYVNPEDRYNVYLFTLGVSYELTGDRNTAVQKYKSVRNNFINERDGELDKLFYRLAQDKIKTPLREIDVKLIKALNLRESNNAEDALIIYNDIISSKMLDKFNSDDDQIRVYFDIGVAYSYNKDFDNAIIAFNKCVKLKPDSEAWLVPHSYFELGKIYDKKGDKNRSSDMFEKIFNYNDFDFESFLEMRLANYGNK